MRRATSSGSGPVGPASSSSAVASSSSSSSLGVLGGLGERGGGLDLRLLGGGQLFGGVDEAGHDLGQALLAGLVQVVFLEQQLDRPREAGQRTQHLGQAFLDALGDGDFAFAGQQLDRAHLAHVHAHRVGGAAGLGIQRRQRGGGFLGGGVVDFAATAGLAGEQQGLGIRRNFVHLDAHAVDHADDVFDLLRVDHVVGKVIVDFGERQVPLFQALADQLLDVGLWNLAFVGHVASHRVRGLGNPALYRAAGELACEIGKRDAACQGTRQYGRRF